MTCRSCGTQIADKALICYRCGTATVEAAVRPAAPTRRSPWPLVGSVVVLALTVLTAIYIGRSVDSDTARLVGWVVVAVAAVRVAILAFARRR
jgi:hypothetical protein